METTTPAPVDPNAAAPAPLPPEAPAAPAPAEAPVATTEASTENPYGLTAMLKAGDPMTITIFTILVLMSLASWYIIFTKLWDQRAIRKSAIRAEKTFWAAGSPKEGAERLPKDDDFRIIAETAVRAAAHHEGRLNDRISLNEWLALALQRSVDNINSKLSLGLSFLATVGSTAPFVGLTGTVYGILNALVNIGIAGQFSVDRVAGPVGEALIMTFIGLIVAVPAVFGYNVLLRRNKAIQDSMREFTSDLQSFLIGGARPADMANAGRPIPAPAAVRK